MRVVLDTNVIISATLIRGGNEDQILRAWQRGAFDLVFSLPILQELGRALFYEKLRKARWMTEEEISKLLQALAQGSVLVPGRVKVKASRDPDDDKFLAAAIEAEARFVVTGDQDLLDLKNYRGVRIVRPLPFLKIIGSASPHRD
ncbi:MAG: putative toxin-antitoxin system toxin component, PIN family [Candidatus Rokubacteria bacterium]|nr:putative toxin-antitoxin system toxin component, PIN family [Candidatus Rokubacteria bacterium]